MIQALLEAGADVNAKTSGGLTALMWAAHNKNPETLEALLAAGIVDFFEGGAAAEAVREQDQWLNAILNDTEPLVRPEQAFVVTQILEGIYRSAESGKEFFF